MIFPGCILEMNAEGITTSNIQQQLQKQNEFESQMVVEPAANGLTLLKNDRCSETENSNSTDFKHHDDRLFDPDIVRTTSQNSNVRNAAPSRLSSSPVAARAAVLLPAEDPLMVVDVWTGSDWRILDVQSAMSGTWVQKTMPTRPGFTVPTLIGHLCWVRMYSDTSYGYRNASRRRYRRSKRVLRKF